jgi:GNAT superfamily N-acetyltransferase
VYLVREVRPDEHERAGALVVAAYTALGGYTSPDYDRELADVGRRAAEADVLVAVAERTDRPVLAGCVTFVPDATSAYAEMLHEGEAGVRMLAVDPASQGHGAGGLLLGACIDRARSLGRAGVMLHSTPWMEAAHRLYERAGFVRAPGRDWAPVPEVPLLAYRLDLISGDGAGAT